MMSKLEQIRSIAQRVRSRVLEHRHNLDVDIDLGGACAIASVALVRVLKREGIDATLVLGQYRNALGNHCWVLVGSRIVDLTATQYHATVEVVRIVSQSEPDYEAHHYGSDAMKYVQAWSRGPHVHAATIDRIVFEAEAFVDETRDRERP